MQPMGNDMGAMGGMGGMNEMGAMGAMNDVGGIGGYNPQQQQQQPPQQEPVQQQGQPAQGQPAQGQYGGVVGGVSGGVSGSAKKSKFWDQASVQEFTQQVQQLMYGIIGPNGFDQNVANLTNQINAASDQCLKDQKKPNYKYISHTLIIPVNGPYNMGQSTYWSAKTDTCITVTVQNGKISAILEAFCVAM